MAISSVLSSVQPSFEDLGTPLCDVTFCVVDLETTGGGAADSITEIGAVKVRGGVLVGEFQTLVNPNTHIPAMIAVLTGITNQMVAGSPRIEAVLPGFLEFSRGTVLVAHNAGFDIGFLKRACAAHDLAWPGNHVIDTVALARQALLRDEVPNCKLATLAAHFRATTAPNHRALSDARATVDVLHGLLERLGNLGVITLDDLGEFSHKVSPQRRAKRTWATTIPDRPGVYWFYCPDRSGYRSESADDQGREVLYVGKSTSLRRRVGSYFTAAEKRPRMEEMIRVAAGVEHVVCATGLEAEIRELRMISAHKPRYNRRSRNQERVLWVKLTRERFPRLSIVRQRGTDDGDYWGPFNRRADAEEARLALYDAHPIRQCTGSVSRRSVVGCALAGMGRCFAPCLQPDHQEEYSLVVARLRQALHSDIRPTLGRIGVRLGELSQQERFEEAAALSLRMHAYTAATLRWNRMDAMARVPQIVAAELVGDSWDIHVIRYGRLAGAARATPGQRPRAVADDTVMLAETVLAPQSGLPAASIEEAERIASWLERPGVRLIEIDGDWSWPLHAGVNSESLPATILSLAEDHGLAAQPQAPSDTSSHWPDLARLAEQPAAGPRSELSA